MVKIKTALMLRTNNLYIILNRRYIVHFIDLIVNN